MHRAGEDRTVGRRVWRWIGGGLAQVFSGIGDEFAAAAGRAEVMAIVLMDMMMWGLRRIDGHPAHRIDGSDAGRLRMNRSCHHRYLLAQPA
jgi:hypothetical protein